MNILKVTVLFSLVSIAIGFSACNDRKEVDALKEETMHIHDEVMKEMGPMNALSRSLKKEMATLDTLSPRLDSLRNIVSKMAQAEEGMMTWMKTYKDPGEDMPKEAAVKYLQEQKAAIEENLKAMKEAMSYK